MKKPPKKPYEPERVHPHIWAGKIGETRIWGNGEVIGVAEVTEVDLARGIITITVIKSKK